MGKRLIPEDCSMQTAFSIDRQPGPMPRSCLLELTVGVQLAAPWTSMSNGRLVGCEVDDARAFAKWLGRPIRFEILESRQIPQALANAEIDLAIGGLRGDSKIREVALSCRYSGFDHCTDDATNSPRLSHVWAIPRRSGALFATLAFYLWMVRTGVPEPVSTPRLTRVH
jgi:hypothetical protein